MRQISLSKEILIDKIPTIITVFDVSRNEALKSLNSRVRTLKEIHTENRNKLRLGMMILNKKIKNLKNEHKVQKKRVPSIYKTRDRKHSRSERNKNKGKK